MKIILQDNNHFVLRFDKGEEIFAGLSDFALKNNVSAATFTGLGTCSMVEIGYFNPFLKEYRKKPYRENYEIVSLTGNLALLEGKPAIHAHGSFSATDFTMLGGHVFKIETLATCEIHLIKLDGKMERKNNPDYNLNLLD
jgi:predicted DNA-binding protein with PD1-like motif